MSIADKLKKLKEAKDAIKDAIIAKGVEVLDTDSFKSYAEKIESIVSGGSGEGNTEQKGVLLENTRGLCFWIDGQCNTRAGLDHSVGYMENLMWNVPNNATASCNAEVLETAGTWNGDYLKLNGHAYYPQVASSQVTVELLFQLDSDFDTLTNERWLICNKTSSGHGWGIQLASGGSGSTFNYGLLIPTGLASAPYLPAREKYKPYYVVATFDNNNTYYKLSVLNTSESIENFSYATLPDLNFHLGLGVLGNSSTGITSANKNRWVGLNIGMARIWNRVLSDEEIQINYQEVKARFGF